MTLDKCAIGLSLAVVVMASTAPPLSAQDTSSWTSGGIVAPQQRGDVRIQRQPATGRSNQRPALTGEPTRLPMGGEAGGSMSTFKPGAGQEPTGDLATTTIRKSGGGNDPAYDAFQQGRYLTAFELASKAAEAGEPQAATLLGKLYQDGLGIKIDQVLAAQWYRRAAELGDLEGTFAFAVMLAEGEGIQKDRVGAAQLFDTAAQKGHALANYNLALLFLKGDGKPENPHRAALHLRYAAEQGIAAAQYDLASLYATGTGVEPNAYHASTWLGRAADQGHPDAELEFGVWLFQGRGVAPSPARGVQYFRSAAEKGLPVAQNRLARALAYGAGIPADPVEASKWHIIARDAGVEDKTLDDLMKKLTVDQLRTAERAAEAWRDAASQ